jgi:hypothetical protein
MATGFNQVGGHLHVVEYESERPEDDHVACWKM